MANWTGSSGCYIRPYRSMVPPVIRSFEESTSASSQVVYLGDVVNSDTVVTSGGLRLVKAPSSGGTGTNVMQVAIKSLIGVAMQGSTGDGSDSGLTSNGLTIGSDAKKLLVCLATPGQEFLGYNSSMETGNGVALRTLVGTNRPLIHDRTFKRFFVGSTNTTAALAAVTITEIPDYAVGDSGAFPIVFKFLSSNVSPVVPGHSQ